MSSSSSASPSFLSAIMHSYPPRHFVGNSFLPINSSPPSSPLPVINPANGQIVTHIPVADNTEITAAITAATNAYTSWSIVSPATRSGFLRTLSSLVSRHSDRIATVESLNTGKPYKEALSDINEASGCFTYYADLLDRLCGSNDTHIEKVKIPDSDYEAEMRYESIGVVAAILPFNYPFLLAAWKIAPALAAGNTIVVKPSELTPLSLLELCHLAIEAGLPAGVLNVILGSGATGSLLVKEPRVNKIGFTGSLRTGRVIAKEAGDRVIPCTLELGGKSSAIVLDDIEDVDVVVEWILLGFLYNAGQVCSSTSRVILHKKVADAFIATLIAAIKRVPFLNPVETTPEGVAAAIANGAIAPPPAGAGFTPIAIHKEKTGFLGPLISKTQHDKVLAYIATAERTASPTTHTLLHGGSSHSAPPLPTTGYFVPPTVFLISSSALASSPLWNEEIFGPVLSITVLTGDEPVEVEALRIANDTEYGLAGAVFGKDEKRCQAVIKGMKIGIGWINCSERIMVQLPWHGMKKSGIGSELGESGLLANWSAKPVVKYRPTTKKLGWYN